MAQDPITRAESDADGARQETTSHGAAYSGRDEFRKEWRRMQQRMLFVAILATGLIIGAMQVS